jgi:hypothetical protein
MSRTPTFLPRERLARLVILSNFGQLGVSPHGVVGGFGRIRSDGIGEVTFLGPSSELPHPTRPARISVSKKRRSIIAP